MKRILLALLLFAAFPSLVKAIDQPYVWPQTVGTSAIQILPANSARKQIVFYNPSASANVAVCPVTSRKDGTAVTCAVNGAGSLTLFPGQYVTITGIGGNPTVGTAWNGIASAPGSALTALEFE